MDGWPFKAVPLRWGALALFWSHIEQKMSEGVVLRLTLVLERTQLRAIESQLVPAAGKVDCEVLKGNPIAPHCIHSGQFLSSRSETHAIPVFESLRQVWSRQSLRCAAIWCFLFMRLRVCMCMHKWRQEVDDRCVSRSLPTFFFNFETRPLTELGANCQTGCQ